MKNLKITSLFLFILAFTAIYTVGCGDDPTTTPPPGGSVPTLDMRVNSIYGFTNDSLDTNGTTVTHTRLRTLQGFTANGTFFGKANSFQIIAETRDTVANTQVSTDTFYVNYEGGKFYQYGMLQIIDPSQPASWDLVADFNISHGTQWTVGTISTIIGGFAVTTTVKGKVAENTAFTTNNTLQSVNNYRIEITGDVQSLGTSLGTIYVDYYIGYADPATNPSGMVRVKVRPIWLRLPPIGTTVFRSPGVDQKIDYWVIP